jgi:hypothetical protein
MEFPWNTRAGMGLFVNLLLKNKAEDDANYL